MQLILFPIFALELETWIKTPSVYSYKLN